MMKYTPLVISTFLVLGLGSPTLVGATPAAGPLAASLLPTSRSVQVGDTATAFATIINAGTTPAEGCSISIPAGIAAIFSYQTTDPITNAPTGMPDTPVDIPGGAAQSFVVSFRTTAPFAPVSVPLVYQCANSDAAPQINGVNTLLLTAGINPVPDIIALAATLSGDGIVSIPGIAGTGVFSVATVNLGVNAPNITATADTGTAILPVALALCETDPESGNCLAPPTPTVSTDIAANATPTFGVFVTASGTVLPNPASNRVFVRFQDVGITRGATSVAVQTAP